MAERFEPERFQRSTGEVSEAELDLVFRFAMRLPSERTAEDVNFVEGLLADVAFLQGRHVDHRLLLIREMRVETLGQGAAVYEQGDAALKMFIVLQGAVALTSSTGLNFSRRRSSVAGDGANVQKYREIKPIHEFGVEALTGNLEHTHGARSLASTVVLTLARDAYDRVTQRFRKQCAQVTVKALEHTWLQRFLSPDELRHVADSIELRIAQPGEVVTRQGDEATACFFVAHGSLSVLRLVHRPRKNGSAEAFFVELDPLGKHGFFGGHSFFSHAKARFYHFSVVARTRAELLEIRKLDFLQLLRRHPGITDVFRANVAAEPYSDSALLRRLTATTQERHAQRALVQSVLDKNVKPRVATPEVPRGSVSRSETLRRVRDWQPAEVGAVRAEEIGALRDVRGARRGARRLPNAQALSKLRGGAEEARRLGMRHKSTPDLSKEFVAAAQAAAAEAEAQAAAAGRRQRHRRWRAARQEQRRLTMAPDAAAAAAAAAASSRSPPVHELLGPRLDVQQLLELTPKERRQRLSMRGESPLVPSRQLEVRVLPASIPEEQPSRQTMAHPGRGSIAGGGGRSGGQASEGGGGRRRGNVKVVHGLQPKDAPEAAPGALLRQ